MSDQQLSAAVSEPCPFCGHIVAAWLPSRTTHLLGGKCQGAAGFMRADAGVDAGVDRAWRVARVAAWAAYAKFFIAVLTVLIVWMRVNWP